MAGKSRDLDSIAKQIRVCLKCPLCQTRTKAVPGDGSYHARCMIIGEAPGKDEDKTGQPFVGSAGRYLDHVLEGSGIERGDFFITNIVKCRPANNRLPKVFEVETCTSNYLVRQIELVNPDLIVLLGGVAAKKILAVKKVEEVRGRIVEHEGRRFLVTYHPAVRFYREDLALKLKKDFELLKKEMQRLAVAA
jgi:uracil-DNA glycosylase